MQRLALGLALVILVGPEAVRAQDKTITLDKPLRMTGERFVPLGITLGITLGGTLEMTGLPTGPQVVTSDPLEMTGLRAGPQVVATDPLEMTGLRAGPQVVTSDPLEMTGLGGAPAAPIIAGPAPLPPGLGLPGNVKVALLRVVALSGDSTNPFDFREVKANIAAAEAGALTSSTLTVLSALPFTNEGPLCIDIVTGSNALQLSVTCPNNPFSVITLTQESVSHVIIGSGLAFTLLSQTPGLGSQLTPVTVTHVARRRSDKVVFKIIFTVDILAPVPPSVILRTRITALSGTLCGTSKSDCP